MGLPPDTSRKIPPPPPVSGRKGGQRLTQLLEQAGREVVIGRDGIPRTRDEMLVDLFWSSALGLEVIGKDENGLVYDRPNTNIALKILERREGRAPAALPDDSDRLTVADRISELARNSINAEADAIVPVSEHAEDLDVSEDGGEGSEESG